MTVAKTASACAAAAATIRIEPLRHHVDAVPLLSRWFEQEWPDWYGTGGRGDARSDLLSFATSQTLPTALVALHDDNICGIAALKRDGLPSHADLTPWIGAGLVRSDMRGRGIGAALLAALEHEAASLGFANVYCATATAESLLARDGWTLLERVLHDSHDLAVFRKAMARVANAASAQGDGEQAP